MIRQKEWFEDKGATRAVRLTPAPPPKLPPPMVPQIRYACRRAMTSESHSGPTEMGPPWQTPMMPGSHIKMEWHNPTSDRPHISVWGVRHSCQVRRTGSWPLLARCPGDLSHEGHVRDLEAVLDRFGPDPVALLGVQHSGPAAIVYAAPTAARPSDPLRTDASGADFWGSTRPASLSTLRQTDYPFFLRTSRRAPGLGG